MSFAKDIILENIYIAPESNCWIWTGDVKDYEGIFPLINLDEGWFHARYYSYFAFIKDYYDTIYLTCENSMCVNPDHMKESKGPHMKYKHIKTMYISVKNVMKLKELAKHGYAYSFKDMSLNTGAPEHIVALTVKKRLWEDIEKHNTEPFDSNSLF